MDIYSIEYLELASFLAAFNEDFRDKRTDYEIAFEFGALNPGSMGALLAQVDQVLHMSVFPQDVIEAVTNRHFQSDTQASHWLQRAVECAIGAPDTLKSDTP